MSKKKSKRKGAGSELYIIIGLGAVIIVLGLIVLTGGFAPPAAQVGSEALVSCNGKPCPSKGDPNAPVTVIEFSDYACHNCRDFSVATEPVIEQEYVETGRVRYVSHVFALWPDSQPAAAAALCANDQGRYWEYHEQAFLNFREGGFPTRDDILNWGRLAGVDLGPFTECVDSGRFLFDAQASALEGRRAGINGTPSFFIGDQLMEGNLPLAQFRAAIDAALAGR